MEICNECGESVKMGSGKRINRIPDCNTEEQRNEMGKPYPEGDFMCADCDGKINRMIEIEHLQEQLMETNKKTAELLKQQPNWGIVCDCDDTDEVFLIEPDGDSLFMVRYCAQCGGMIEQSEMI